MTNTYIKPETKVCQVKVNAGLMLGSIDPTPATTPAEGREYSFDFFMEEEEVPGKSDDEDWEDWEDEDDP